MDHTLIITLLQLRIEPPGDCIGHKTASGGHVRLVDCSRYKKDIAGGQSPLPDVIRTTPGGVRSAIQQDSKKHENWDWLFDHRALERRNLSQKNRNYIF